MSTESSHNPFAARRIGLEEEYFRKQDADLTAKLRAVFERKVDRDELRQATGIRSDDVIDRLLAIHAKGEMLLAFRLYPLVEMAWADGSVATREAKAVVNAATKLGVAPESAALHAIEEWIGKGPTDDGRSAWYMYANELRQVLSPAELDKFREDLLAGATSVAEASGGFLGIASPISPQERQVLARIAKALTHG
jgi:tellurite resistance protein